MANVKIPSLPVAPALSGDEQLEIVQGGTSKRTTVRAMGLATVAQTAIISTVALSSYPVVDSDRARVIVFTNAGAVAVTLPAPTSSTFISGWYADFENRGAGTVTITSPATINGAASIRLQQNQSVCIDSDGSVYYGQTGMATQDQLFLSSNSQPLATGGLLRQRWTSDFNVLYGTSTGYQVDINQAPAGDFSISTRGLLQFWQSDPNSTTKPFPNGGVPIGETGGTFLSNLSFYLSSDYGGRNFPDRPVYLLTRNGSGQVTAITYSHGTNTGYAPSATNIPTLIFDGVTFDSTTTKAVTDGSGTITGFTYNGVAISAGNPNPGPWLSGVVIMVDAIPTGASRSITRDVGPELWLVRNQTPGGYFSANGSIEASFGFAGAAQTGGVASGNALWFRMYAQIVDNTLATPRCDVVFNTASDAGYTTRFVLREGLRGGSTAGGDKGQDALNFSQYWVSGTGYMQLAVNDLVLRNSLAAALRFGVNNTDQVQINAAGTAFEPITTNVVDIGGGTLKRFKIGYLNGLDVGVAGSNFASLMRVTADAGAPLTGAGLQFSYNAGVGLIQPFNAGSSTNTDLRLLANSTIVQSIGTSYLFAATSITANAAPDLGASGTRFGIGYLNGLDVGVLGSNFASLARITAASGAPFTGEGLQLSYNASQGLVQAYNAGTGLDTALKLQGLSVQLQGGTQTYLFASGSLTPGGGTNPDIGASGIRFGKVWAGAGDFAGQVLIADNTVGSTVLTLQTTESGAVAAPTLLLKRLSASPAVSDNLGGVQFIGQNSAAAQKTYVEFATTIIDPTSGSEDGQFDLYTMVAGTSTLSVRVSGGVAIGAPTGGVPGVGSLNVAGEIYKNNVAYVNSARIINTTAPLTGGGDLSVDRTFSITSSALTKVDDSNVTLTLGGSPTTALLAGVSLTLGWAGTLGLSRGGINANLSATGGAGQFLKQASPGAAITVSAPVISEIGGLGAGVAAFLGSSSSANLAAAVTDETGSGLLVFATSPTLVTPALGTPSAIVLTNATGLPTAGLLGDAVTYAKIQNVSATDKLLGRSTAGAGDVEEIACTAAGRAILDDADSAAQRVTLGLGTSAVKNTGTSGNNVPLLDGANSASGVNSFTNTAVSTSPSTGAVVITGGLGVGGSAYAAAFNTSGALSGVAVFDRTNPTQYFQFYRDLNVVGFYDTTYGGNFLSFGSSKLSVLPSTVSSSPTTGALVVAGGVGIGGELNWTGTAWTAYSPTISASSGSFTTVTATEALYKLMGKTCHVRLKLTLTTIGTAGTSTNVSLPFDVSTASAGNGVNITGSVLLNVMTRQASASTLTFVAGGGAFGWTNGDVVYIFVTYQTV